MIKKYIWPILHPIRFHSRIHDTWGFFLKEDIHLLKRNLVQEKNKTEQKQRKDFETGVKQGYYQIYNSFYKKQNFLFQNYTTPKLSIALNILQRHFIHSTPLLNFDSLDVKVLNSSVEIGFAKSNDKILGFWNTSCIQNEIMIGMIGPEYQSIWNQQPLCENVNVLYKFDNRIDIWQWQRSLTSEKYSWQVSNINGILV